MQFAPVLKGFSTMSGRVRVNLADGRRVTGFRKTLRQNPRLRPEDRPELRFTFMLPPALAFSTRAGVYGFATVDPDGMVTVRGRERDFVLRKAGEFLRSIAHGLTLDPIDATLFCPSHRHPVDGMPDRPGYSDGYLIVVACGTPSVVVSRSSIKPLVVT